MLRVVARTVVAGAGEEGLEPLVVAGRRGRDDLGLQVAAEGRDPEVRHGEGVLGDPPGGPSGSGVGPHGSDLTDG